MSLTCADNINDMRILSICRGLLSIMCSVVYLRYKLIVTFLVTKNGYDRAE